MNSDLAFKMRAFAAAEDICKVEQKAAAAKERMLALLPDVVECRFVATGDKVLLVVPGEPRMPLLLAGDADTARLVVDALEATRAALCTDIMVGRLVMAVEA